MPGTTASGRGQQGKDVPPLLRALAPEEQRQVMDAARPHRFARGEVVFHEGDRGDSLHMITTGRFAARVSTRAGYVATLAVFGAGEFFGELALLNSKPERTATIAALEKGETLSIDRGTFEELWRSNPSVAALLLSILTDKLRFYTDRMVEALYTPAEIRVLRRLLELTEVYATDEEDVVVPLRQEDLAGLAGTSRATVNRVLREEERAGSIRLDRGRIRVIDRTRLVRRGS